MIKNKIRNKIQKPALVVPAFDILKKLLKPALGMPALKFFNLLKPALGMSALPHVPNALL